MLATKASVCEILPSVIIADGILITDKMNVIRATTVSATRESFSIMYRPHLPPMSLLHANK